MHEDVEKYIEKCEICLKNKPPNQNTLNKAIETVRPNEIWEIDLIGRIPVKTKATNSYLLQSITTQNGLKRL